MSLGVQLIPGGYISLEEKVTALAKAGFDGVDVYMWGLVPYTEHMFNRKLSQKNVFDFSFTKEDWKLLIQAAERLGTLCNSHNLKVISAVCLFEAEGWPQESEQAAKARENLQQWSSLMTAIGTDMLVVS